MTQRIKLPERDPGVKVELGTDPVIEYRMVPVTMELEEKLNDLEAEARRVEANPDSKPFDLCEAEAKQLDVILEPLPRPAGDGKTDPMPTELLLPGYQKGDITRAQIRTLVERIVTAARPT